MVDFTPIDGVHYSHEYNEIFSAIAAGDLPEVATYRQLILDDLFFIVYFVMEIPIANKAFVVNACQDVELGSKTKTLDIWSRGHFKSTIITIAETVQYHLKNPEHCTCIFSYSKPAADKFLNGIRRVWEMPMMRKCFPDLLYDKPETESPSWSLQNGIIIKRKSTSRRESTIESSGLVEGMHTGGHYERRLYDDVETKDIAKNPEQLLLCYESYEMSKNLGMDGGVERVIGTYYSHSGPLIKIRDKVDINGAKMFTTRIKPATVDGTASGKPVFLSQEALDDLKMDSTFNAQQLCDPTPSATRSLHSEYLQEIDHEFIPKNTYNFMLVDPAGDNVDGSGNSWGILLVGVDPDTDNVGLSNIYIRDMLLSPLTHSESIEEIVRMYLRGGIVELVGVEKVSQCTTHIHIRDALFKRGKRINEENGRLVLLKPSGRHKTDRIESALSWPLDNGKLFISKDIPQRYRDQLRTEMDGFPFVHPDGLDALSYLYDILPDYKFAERSSDDVPGNKMASDYDPFSEHHA